MPCALPRQTRWKKYVADVPCRRRRFRVRMRWKKNFSWACGLNRGVDLRKIAGSYDHPETDRLQLAMEELIADGLPTAISRFDSTHAARAPAFQRGLSGFSYAGVNERPLIERPRITCGARICPPAPLHTHADEYVRCYVSMVLLQNLPNHPVGRLARQNMHNPQCSCGFRRFMGLILAVNFVLWRSYVLNQIWSRAHGALEESWISN